MLNEVVKDINVSPEKVRILGGRKFTAQISNLMPDPFINDNQIVSLDIEKNKLILDSVAAKKIVNLKHDNYNGVQFAITVDNKIVFQGYFWSTLSSFCCPFIGIYPPIGAEEIDDYVWTENVVFDIFLSKYRKSDYPQKLIDAFRISGRLIEN